MSHLFRLFDNALPPLRLSTPENPPANTANGNKSTHTLCTTNAAPDLQAKSIHGTSTSSPEKASAKSASCEAAAINLPITAEPTEVSEPDDPILGESAAYHKVGVDVRRATKKEFGGKRNDLRKNWPEFDKVYDDYRRWRDSPSDPNGKIEKAGRLAQSIIMERANLSDEQKRLFALLSASDPPSSLLRFVSPINGDFRAPKEGLVAGLRYATDHGKRVPTLAFPGTGAGSMIRAQMRTNLNQFFGKGGVPEAYELGAKLAAECHGALNQQYPQAEPLAFTGHSLGGGIASFAAASVANPEMDYQPMCYTFNPAGLGGATIKKLEEFTDLKERIANQKIIRVKNDHVSSPAMQRRLAAFLLVRTHRLIAVPRHIGAVYVIPRQWLDKSRQNVLMLHSLESLISVYAMARYHLESDDSTRASSTLA